MESVACQGHADIGGPGGLLVAPGLVGGGGGGDHLVDSTQAANAREVAVATGKLVSGEGKAAVGSVRVDDFTPMIEFLASHKILGDKKTPKAAEVCVPLPSPRCRTPTGWRYAPWSREPT